MKLGLLQLNYIVGDLNYNADKIIQAVRSLSGKVDFCITSELALTGYPPKDLLLHEGFVSESINQVQYIAKALKGSPALLLGCFELNTTGVGKPLYNAAVFIEDGEIKQSFHKVLIPTYDVFDEDRYFESGRDLNCLEWRGKRFGITICEDIWNNEILWRFPRYAINPLEKLAEFNLDGVINLSASPYFMQKQTQVREPLMKTWAQKYHLPFFYVNQVGGNDELIFDGCSCFIDAQGQLLAQAKSFEEDILLVNFPESSSQVHISSERDHSDLSLVEEEVFKALVCGTQDYVGKCGFKKAVLGLSGGIDSALTLVVAVQALGKENVMGVLMPSPYSSQGSVDDACQLAENLGVKTYTFPIDAIMREYDRSLEQAFQAYHPDTTEENLQARIRGNLLMALSNKFNALLLTTGNKSELSVGYCTIYGDMCGGLALISDVYKTLVYRIAKWINFSCGKEIIPQNTLDKAPSAELRPHQCDQDSLPPYDILDDILYRYIELHQSANQIVVQGQHELKIVTQVLGLVTRAEFKRRQAAPGFKITARAYGCGWRMPIAARYNSMIEFNQPYHPSSEQVDKTLGGDYQRAQNENRF